MDAFTPPLEQHLEQLAHAAKRLLASDFARNPEAEPRTKQVLGHAGEEFSEKVAGDEVKPAELRGRRSHENEIHIQGGENETSRQRTLFPEGTELRRMEEEAQAAELRRKEEEALKKKVEAEAAQRAREEASKLAEQARKETEAERAREEAALANNAHSTVKKDSFLVRLTNDRWAILRGVVGIFVIAFILFWIGTDMSMFFGLICVMIGIIFLFRIPVVK
jgi:hypothetical protein